MFFESMQNFLTDNIYFETFKLMDDAKVSAQISRLISLLFLKLLNSIFFFKQNPVFYSLKSI